MAIIPPVPALLHTSRETREIATKHYRPVWLDDKSNFNNTMLALLVRNSEKYIDYQQDTLYYGAEDPPVHGIRFLEVQQIEKLLFQVSKIKRVAIHQDIFMHDPEYREDFLNRLVHSCGHLEHLTIVLPPDDDENQRDFEASATMEVSLIPDFQPSNHFIGTFRTNLRPSIKQDKIDHFIRIMGFAKAVYGTEKYKVPSLDGPSIRAFPPCPFLWGKWNRDIYQWDGYYPPYTEQYYRKMYGTEHKCASDGKVESDPAGEGES